ncbi:MAG: hypothetical protein HOD43_11255 [Candidatus Marinimicrobia bacterium]|nr:hypothetical protein [Candidatus Neomarinimicrobiota bacterium]MBT3630321.1 hypothetical protein [Candidatus Neomarinimicrobiota bacterium]MBT4132360.1 hypothetical protein [Candidatus Neomarinimicrobiota bacterium]MBT4296369.1 hypothetical protein [Candidatus Neomarinimicrobiota bacterium]MBT4421444.1 hypothetical protein [Candidatus Neomarinimicrobiota bacterium]
MKKILVLLIAGLLMLSIVQANEPQDSPAKLKVDKRMLKNFVKSLIIPGWGQWENGNKTRGILYLTAELAGIYGYQSNYSAGADKEVEFKLFGDEYWSYDRWSSTNTGETACGGNLRTHQMPTFTDGNNIEQPIKDHHFYENISKYPEFVCGWDDIAQVDDDDLTPHKLTYVEMRTHSNELYRNAQLAGTLIMVNHLISAFDAALGTDMTSFESSSFTGKLYINPLNVVRGISMEVTF